MKKYGIHKQYIVLLTESKTLIEFLVLTNVILSAISIGPTLKMAQMCRFSLWCIKFSNNVERIFSKQFLFDKDKDLLPQRKYCSILCHLKVLLQSTICWILHTVIQIFFSWECFWQMSSYLFDASMFDNVSVDVWMGYQPIH